MRIQILFVLATVVAGCSDFSPPPVQDSPEDTGILDDSDVGGETDTPDDDTPAGFGEDCLGHADCASGYCVHAGEEVGTCTTLCAGECSREGYSCRTLRDPMGAQVSVCYPDSTPQCESCSGHDECGSGSNLCLDGADGPHCALRCEEGDLCPLGYECQEQTIPGNDVLKVCAIVDATCDECAGLDFENDPANCGWCGNVCPEVNGRSTCAEGRCVVECTDGWADCNQDAGDGCETELSAHCGTCAALEGVPGEACGTCGSGRWACDGNEGVICAGDFGPNAFNACGGCEDLPVTLGDACGTCASGRWACNGPDAVACADDAGNAAVNLCGGCADLGGAPGDACGACGDGRLICQGIDALVCSDAQPRNGCGGCGTLANNLGDTCGPCGLDVFVCDGQEAVICGGATTNVCGGCARLEGDRGDACGACEDGVFSCDGVDDLVCEGASEPDFINACGGCEELLREPGESCGACFNAVYVCDGRNGIRCQTGEDDNPRALTEIGGDLFAQHEGDTRTLTQEGGPYLITSSAVVPEGKTLEIGPGTLLKFAIPAEDAPRLEFVVRGTMLARGTQRAPVVFTSAYDDCNGGDTNGDGVATSAAAGDWGLLDIDSASTELHEVYAYYAGGRTDREIPATAVRVHGVRAPAALDGLRTWFSAGLGLDIAVTGGFRTVVAHLDLSTGAGGLRASVAAGGINLTDVVARENEGPGIDVRSAGDVLAQRLTAADNDGDGIRLVGDRRVDLGASSSERHPGFSDLWIVGNDESRVRGNRFTADGDVPLARRDVTVTTSPNLVQEVVGNNELENTERGVHIVGGDIPNHLAWPAPHVYTVLDTVEVLTSGGLTLPQGSVVKFAVSTEDAPRDASLVVHGRLAVQGVDGERVTFTSAFDDAAGGDTNGDGVSTGPEPGDWGGIVASEMAQIAITRADLRYGGGGDDGERESDAPGVAALWLTTSTAPVLSHVTAAHSQSGGILVETSDGLPWSADVLVVEDCLGEAEQAGLQVQCGPGHCSFERLSVQRHGDRGAVFAAEGDFTLDRGNFGNNQGDGITVDAAGRVLLESNVTAGNAGFGINLIEGDATSVVTDLLTDGNDRAARTHPRLVEQLQVRNVLRGDSLWVTAGTIGHITTWQEASPALVVEGVVEVAPGARLAMQPGVVIKFVPGTSGLVAGGRLGVVGSQTRPVVMTSYLDDALGDTNRDGQASSPAAGDWAGLHVLPTGSIEMRFATLSYMGGSFDDPDQPGVAGLHVEGHVAALGNISLLRSGSGGLTFQPANPGDVGIAAVLVRGAAPGFYGLAVIGGADRVSLSDIVISGSGHGIRTERDGYVSITRGNISNVHTCLSVAGPTRGDIYSIDVANAEFGLVFHTCPAWTVHSASYGQIRNQSPDPCR